MIMKQEEKAVASKLQEQEEFMARVGYISENSELVKEHGQTLSKCAICHQTFSTAKVYTHVSLYHCNITYPCSLCENFRGNRKNMKKHIENDHEEYSSLGRGNHGGFCTLCNKFVTNIVKHTKRVHLMIKQCSCTLCGKEFHEKGDLDRHHRQVHSYKKEMCPECGKYVKRVKSHLYNVHSDRNLETACPVCGKSIHDLKDHMKSVHEKVKNYSCTMCPLQTYKLNTLKRHMIVHEKYASLNKPYPYHDKNKEYNLENMEEATELVLSGKMSRRKAAKQFNLSVHGIKEACVKASLI